jgi:hypothetical protein
VREVGGLREVEQGERERERGKKRRHITFTAV